MKKLFVYFTMFFLLGSFSLSAAPMDYVNSDIVLQNETVEISYDELPDAVKTALKDEQYADWTIESIFKVAHPDYEAYYSIEFSAGGSTQVVNFDAEGNVIQ